MSHNTILPTKNSWKNLKEYHIDEEVGFVLPTPQVRQRTDVWAKIFSYHYLPEKVNFC